GGRLKRGEVAGRVVDLGGQWVGPRHGALLAEAERFGVTSYKQYDEGKTVLQMLGKVVAFEGDVPRLPPLALIELMRLPRRWDRDIKCVPADAPWTSPQAQDWDSQTLESWITKHVHTKAGRAFARLVPRGAWAAEARQVSYLWFIDALRGSDGLAH